MRKKKTQAQADDVFEMPSAGSIYIFRASDVTRILGIEKWRLEKFLTGKQYRLSPSGHIGKGKGSWRLFSRENLYRLEVASRIVEDGFTAKFVSMVLQEIDDSELLDIDEHGATAATDLWVVRSATGPRVVFPSIAEKNNMYYVIPLRQWITNVNERIAA
jgi:hypothetical protein